MWQIFFQICSTHSQPWHCLVVQLFEVVFSGCLSGMWQICRPLGDHAGQIADKVIWSLKLLAVCCNLWGPTLVRRRNLMHHIFKTLTRVTSPQSNLRRSRHSWVDKKHPPFSSRNSHRGDFQMDDFISWHPAGIENAAAKMAAGHSLLLLWQWRCCGVCCVTSLYINFSSTPTSILNLTIS